MTKPVQLYGGAITTVMPEGFVDVSMIREVPDTQEVYVNNRESKETFTDGLGYNESIIVDLLEQVTSMDLKLALGEHLEDIFQLNGSTKYKVEQLKQIDNHNITCIVWEETHKSGKQARTEIVMSCIGLIRLAEFTTDVLVTMNVPLSTSDASTIDLKHLPAQVRAAYKILQEIVKKFKVIDKSLFA
ncbi:hypothetical protein TBLA_0B10080 [Henningerozyma blattae CBS 6284]|uniref:Uncharacterized protein n=1 Tax=Henningerozyma blattae (strain ATCC 34711 / CBS 6284 / DSM 70876 / NBRC 10599 / NRRL Y-10934 / UCD 77-7) TaxID=1071380 RepID=I2H0C3_HENB6|nr:hypothetical protein TBLA_0B10080 [Tetrapisispora blattae CBS 6284]CCH59825.1 hypothetical protein TBLA_0B10080 [Tetrapisispora blattae CBS 6284]